MQSTNALETTNFVSQGAAITVVSVVNQHIGDILMEMLPFCYVALPLILLDLHYGRKKAKYEYENNISTVKCTWQRSIKMTLQKIFNYVSWIFLSTSLSMAFGSHTLIVIIMSIIYGLEVLSLLNKYTESKGIYLDEAAIIKLVFKFIWSRITGNNEETFNDVVKKQNENEEPPKDVNNISPE